MDIPAATIVFASAAIYLAIGVLFADEVDRHNRQMHFKHIGHGYPVIMLLWPVFALILKLK